MKLHALLTGAWAGVLWFFTFGIARTLFAVFPRDRAGEVTTALFPTYFTVTIVLGLLATAALWPHRRGGRRMTIALILQLLALGALATIPVLIAPALAAHAPGTAGFRLWHGASMALNLFSLLAVPAAWILISARSRARNL
ncbi:MAG: DUF4149 domain-containing protein [Chthoniobacterales bacterium]|jgi:hypothetical protein